MCNGCHDMSMKAISMHFLFMSENDALNLIKNAVIIDKKATL